MRKRAVSLIVGVVLLTEAGCRVPNKQYRVQLDKSVVTIPEPNIVPINQDVGWVLGMPHSQWPLDISGASTVRVSEDYTVISPPLITPDNKRTDPEMAFIEFDDLGDSWSKPNQKNEGTQLDWALGLIRAAKAASLKTGIPPLVMVYIHGWNHNAQDTSAKDEDQNVQGFKRVLLNLADQDKNQVVIGIYLSWRGELFRDEWPVSQALSGWNRESAATRVGSDGPVTDALLQIAHEARYKSDGTILTDSSQRPILIYAGHSYGALILQRSLMGAWIAELDSRDSALLKSGIPPFADLTIFVNPASDANQTLPLLDLLAQKQILYQVDQPDSSGKTVPVDYPLFLSITSPADDATRFLLPIGHFFPAMKAKWLDTSLRAPDPVSCYDPLRPPGQQVGILNTQTEWDFSMTSAPHMEALQSHVLIEKQIDRKAKPEDIALAEKAISECRTRDYAGSDKSVFDTYALPGKCFVIEARQDRCNGTPYWIMDTNKDIIPAHSTIFTVRLIDLIEKFLPVVREGAAQLEPELELVQPPTHGTGVFDRPSLRTTPTIR